MDTPVPTQPVTQPAPQPVMTPTAPAPSGGPNRLVLILSGIIILLIGLGGGYFLMRSTSNTPSKAMETSPTPVSDSKAPIVVTPTPTASPDANWLTYTGTKLDSVSLAPYSIKYPAAWTPLNTKNEVIDTYTLTDGDYQIAIHQAPMGGGGCLFEGDMPEGEFQPQDLRSTKYVDIKTNSGLMFRRYLSPSAKPAGTLMEFCATTDGDFWGKPTQLGVISYKLPVGYTEIKLQEMDSIIKTLKAVE